MPEYGLHVQFSADDDTDALRTAEALMNSLPNELVLDHAVTDWEDWAEHVTERCAWDRLIGDLPMLVAFDCQGPVRAYGVGIRLCLVHHTVRKAEQDKAELKALRHRAERRSE